MKFYLVSAVLLTSLNTFFVDMAYAQFGKLTSVDHEKILRGEIVHQEKMHQEKPWPERMLFLKVDASPLEAMAVFAAYNYQKNYVPNVIKSEVTEHLGPLKTIVDYEHKTPWPLPNIKFKQKHQLVKRGKEIFLYWKQVESSATKENYGSVSFVPYKGKTLMIYNAMVYPNSIFAGLIKETAKEKLFDSLKAIREHTQQLKSSSPAKLDELKKLITDAFQGKLVYKNKTTQGQKK